MHPTEALDFPHVPSLFKQSVNCGSIDLTSFLYRLFTLENVNPGSFLTLAQNLLYCTLSWVVRFQEFTLYICKLGYILHIYKVNHFANTTCNHFVLITACPSVGNVDM